MPWKQPIGVGPNYRISIDGVPVHVYPQGSDVGSRGTPFMEAKVKGFTYTVNGGIIGNCKQKMTAIQCAGEWMGKFLEATNSGALVRGSVEGKFSCYQAADVQAYCSGWWTYDQKTYYLLKVRNGVNYFIKYLNAMQQVR